MCTQVEDGNEDVLTQEPLHNQVVGLYRVKRRRSLRESAVEATVVSPTASWSHGRCRCRVSVDKESMVMEDNDRGFGDDGDVGGDR